jgi:hypothetical protein
MGGEVSVRKKGEENGKRKVGQEVKSHLRKDERGGDTCEHEQRKELKNVLHKLVGSWERRGKRWSVRKGGRKIGS